MRRATTLSAVKRPSRPDDALRQVRGQLAAYAQRGVFRGFSEVESTRQSAMFRFVWLFDRQMQFEVDIAKGVLRCRRLLPGVAASSPLYVELKESIARRHDAELPEHRRIDPARAKARLSNRGGAVSISLQVLDGDFAYGTNRLVNLVHELFVQLRDAWPEYLMEQFDASRD